jgi:hypothetical protein
VCTFGLCLASHAGAQSYEGGLNGPNPALSGISRLSPERGPLRVSMAPSVQFTNDTIIRHDGTPGDRRSIVGSLPIAGLVSAELGLFSVTGATVGERELKRTDPIADVQPRRSRVAAVGLRMNF